MTQRRGVVFKLALAGAVVVSLIGALAGYEAIEATRAETREFISTRSVVTPPELTPAVRSVALRTSEGKQVGAWYAPSSNGAAILLVHGTDDTRVQLWPELKLLNAAGFGVLSIDLPGHGESDGPIGLGARERAALKAAIDWLSTQPDVQRIGAFGFSLGSALVTIQAADDPRIRAVVAAGCFTDAVDQVGYEWRHANPVARWAAKQVNVRHIEHGDLRPIDAAPKLKGRHVLFINGTDDDDVDPANGAALAAVTGTQQWLVPGAGHGDFGRVLGDAWGRRLIEFFSTNL